MSNLQSINFGFSSAEAERSRDPGLLIDGYVDIEAASESAVNGNDFLFLGYKGTGKSSIAERVDLIYADEPNVFVKTISLSDFPFTQFSKIVRGNIEPESKFTTAWMWIILIYLLDSFSKDSGIHHPDVGIFNDAINSFKQMGLSPSSDITSIVRNSSKKNFSLSLPGKLASLNWSGSEQRPASEIPDFVESLREIIRPLRSYSKHILIIDGLDDVLTSRQTQYKSLSALIFEMNRLNNDLEKNNVPAKVVVLCRTDIFEQIPGANNNKIRQDFSLELDWYHDPREPEKSLLIRIAQLRAKRSLKREVDIFKSFFPSYLDRKEIKQYLLDMTRHTPRDFLRLLEHIKKFSQSGRLSSDEIKSGLRDYSIRYFLPEIRDELSGYAEPSEIDSFIQGLSRLRRRDFYMDDLLKSMKETNSNTDEERIFEITDSLFRCSAIGNIQYRKGGSTFYTFKYRNRHSSFNPEEAIMLHRGLWKALNLM